MSDAVVYEQLDESAPAGAGADPDLRRLSDVPLELSVEIGRTRMTVGETLQLRPGSILTLERLAGEPVDLLVNGTPIARGEVVVVDEQFGLRVSELIEGDVAAQALAEERPDAAALGLGDAQPDAERTSPAPPTAPTAPA
ncbi:MAG TPA: flagellar motor switch protein FliN [Solirubrobacteraceae bacterium]|jgi:flagellar motor switch protein FliN/FliY|nr:flagellar motor switch protein FliN [Solirubrobacteraceae bacterium]